ncbi:GPW/gp25 family protein [Frankia sp. CiP1_Cm_nod2]|uniref:GPW/gp25 family protein n=1 Tax=Frankia sp. CiP1_Cm_nod2 TaxID=2897161 RepID=UPI002023F8C6
MTDAAEPRWGSDLRLLDDLRLADDRGRGSDLFTVRRPQTGQDDLETLSALDNLRQALLLRFLTEQGELALFGHPDYGSRLHELVGQPNTESTRNRAKMFTLLALTAEPRVARVLSVDVATHPRQRWRIDITARLLPVHGDTPLNLVFPFFLDRTGAA